MTDTNYSANRIPLREAIEDPNFATAREESKLVIPLGTGDDGSMEVLNLCSEPHLLVAGSVNSGKTEFLNCIIASLALCSRPDEVNLILDDVTRVELSSFNGLPHLVRPVVVYVEEALEALHWLDREVAARYQRMAAVKATNILAYNQGNRPGKLMPYLVVVIYELSDLMIGFPEAVEPLICKLARSSPDAGIHLVIATQRPAPEVITGTLKASFTARVCFSVISSTDSMVVLDTEGAEKLNERGEMLYLVTGESRPRRLQGFHIADAEIDNLVAYGKLHL
jgi:S-DNA-T family DNA segregation ATPase FtsK/SpoIIIE